MARRIAIRTAFILGIGTFIVIGARTAFLGSPQFPGNGEQARPSPKNTEASAVNPNDGAFLVARVIDGDTIELEGGDRVRYIGMDTPETVDPRKPVQCFGEEASTRNKELVEGKRVRLEKDVSEKDKYGRLLRYVYIGNQFVNLILVQEGFAHAYTYPPDVSHAREFIAAERTAREGGKGLWGGCSKG